MVLSHPSPLSVRKERAFFYKLRRAGRSGPPFLHNFGVSDNFFTIFSCQPGGSVVLSSPDLVRLY